MPAVVDEYYNNHMGGAWLIQSVYFLLLCENYIPKMYYPLFAWCINAFSVNSWRLYRRLLKSKQHPTNSLLEFQRAVALHLLSYGSLPKRTGPSLWFEECRYDSKEHSIRKGTHPNLRCKQRGGQTVYIICQKCNVPLHPKCDALYFGLP